MKQVSMMSIVRSKRLIVPVGVVALGMVAVAVGQSHPQSAKLTATDSQATQASSPATESPAPSATPTITVDGQVVAPDQDGSTEVTTINGKTSVSSSGGHTTVVTSSDDAERGDTSNQKSGNVSIQLDSSSNGGTHNGSVRTYGVNTSNDNSSTSFSRTSVYSSGSDHVSVSQ